MNWFFQLDQGLQLLVILIVAAFAFTLIVAFVHLAERIIDKCGSSDRSGSGSKGVNRSSKSQSSKSDT